MFFRGSGSFFIAVNDNEHSLGPENVKCEVKKENKKTANVKHTLLPITVNCDK